MSVNELIERLQALPPEQRALPVALADWNEGYVRPSVEAAVELTVTDSLVVLGASAADLAQEVV